MNKAPIFALILIAAVEAAVAGTEYKSSGDLGTYEVPDGTTLIDLHNSGLKAVSNYTLSQDRAFDVQTLVWPHNGATLNFNFADDGNHTLTLNAAGFHAFGTGKANFNGGVWDFNGKYIQLVGGNTQATTNLTLTLDGAVFTNYPSGYLLCSDAKNSTLELKNGAKLIGNYYDGASLSGYFINHAKLASDGKSYKATGNRLIVSSGSKIITDRSISFGPCDTTLCTTPIDFEALFTGEGTELYAGQNISIGQAVAGMKMKFADNAKGICKVCTYIGGKSNATDNQLSFESGATYKSDYYVWVGQTKGADRSSLEIKDSSFTVGNNTEQGIVVGYASCDNRLVVSNSTVEIGYLTLGYEMGACSNTAIIAGQATDLKITSPNLKNSFFGMGMYNSLTFDDCTIDSTGFIYRFDGTNNMVRLVNGANVTASNVRMGFEGNSSSTSYPSISNTLYIGSGCVLNSKSQFIQSGRDCKLIIDDATFNCANQYSFYMGHVDSKYTTHTVSNNMVIFRGLAPKIRSASDNSTMSFANSTTVRFELPPEGYAEAPIIGYNIGFNSNNCKIEIAGIEAIQEKIGKRITMPLIEAGTKAKLDSAIGSSVINKVNATLPAGCYIAKSDNKLLLSVKPKRPGFMIIWE